MDDGEDDEGGMVTGKSHQDVTARRHHSRTVKKKSRRERQQEIQRHAEADEDDDSSDLSDESDEETESMHRFVPEFLSSVAQIMSNPYIAPLIRSSSPRCPFAEIAPIPLKVAWNSMNVRSS